MNLFEENREALQQYVDRPDDPDHRQRVKETMRLVIEALQLMAGADIATRLAEGFAVFIAEVDRLQASSATRNGDVDTDDLDETFEVDRTRDMTAAHDRLKAVLLDVIERLQRSVPR